MSYRGDEDRRTRFRQELLVIVLILALVLLVGFLLLILSSLGANQSMTMKWYVIREGEVVGHVHAHDEIDAEAHAAARYPPREDDGDKRDGSCEEAEDADRRGSVF